MKFQVCVLHWSRVVKLIGMLEKQVCVAARQFLEARRVDSIVDHVRLRYRENKLI